MLRLPASTGRMAHRFLPNWRNIACTSWRQKLRDLEGSSNMGPTYRAVIYHSSSCFADAIEVVRWERQFLVPSIQKLSSLKYAAIARDDPPNPSNQGKRIPRSRSADEYALVSSLQKDLPTNWRPSSRLKILILQIFCYHNTFSLISSLFFAHLVVQDIGESLLSARTAQASLLSSQNLKNICKIKMMTTITSWN